MYSVFRSNVRKLPFKIIYIFDNYMVPHFQHEISLIIEKINFR